MTNHTTLAQAGEGAKKCECKARGAHAPVPAGAGAGGGDGEDVAAVAGIPAQVGYDLETFLV